MPTEISGSTGVNKIQDNTIVDADINSSAAIAGSKLVMPAGSVVQVVESGMDGTADHSAGATSYSTLYSGSLTNVAANSVVIGWVNITGNITNTGSDVAISCFQGTRIMGGGTATNGDNSGLMTNLRIDAGSSTIRGTGMFIDNSPPTGTVQYDVKVICENTFTVGRGERSGAARHQRPRNNIILMEIAV